jgi:acid phosphatase family membrane protein YuiD
VTFFNGIMKNEVFNVALTSWFIAQALKVVLTLLTQKKFDLYRFVGSGGMPSSHSSIVMGLSTSVGLKTGWDSVSYAISLVFALIVMYDAAGVRRAVGKQAIILNRMLEDMHNHRDKHIQEKRLKELVGHTPVEVFAGAILGIVIANLMI